MLYRSILARIVLPLLIFVAGNDTVYSNLIQSRYEPCSAQARIAIREGLNYHRKRLDVAIGVAQSLKELCETYIGSGSFFVGFESAYRDMENLVREMEEKAKTDK